MRRSYGLDSQKKGGLPNLVFYAPLATHYKDEVSGTEGQDNYYAPLLQNKVDAYFNGSDGLKYPFSSLSFKPNTWTIDTSFTILIDYFRTANSGHDWMFVVGTDSDKQLIGFLYEANSDTISLALSTNQYPHWTACNNRTYYTELNKQYRKCGIVYDGNTHTAYRVIDGVFVNSFLITKFPTIPANGYVYVGSSSYNSDRMNGYLCNMRVYDEALTEQQISEI